MQKRQPLLFWSCSSNGFFHRQYKHEPCPLLVLLVQQHFPFQPFGDEAADIESQAGALPEVVGLFKTFEDGFRVFRGMPVPVSVTEKVTYPGFSVRAVQADFALCGVFLCIGKEVDEYLAHTLPVGAQFVAVVHFGGVVELHAFGLAVFNGGYGFPAELVATVRRYLHGVSVAFQLGCAEDVPTSVRREVGIVLYEMAEILPFLLGKVRVGEVMSCEKPTIELSGVRIS